MITTTRRVLGILLFATFGSWATLSHAVLMGTTVEGSGFLQFDAAPGGLSTTQPTTGSWFSIEPTTFGYLPIASLEGVAIQHFAQPASGSHAGAPDGSESPSIDQAHHWFGNTGMWGSVSPVTILSASGNTATLDFSGIRWNWAGNDNIPVTDASNGDTGIATVVCAIDCSYGDSYVLDFAGHIPVGDPSGLGGFAVQMHLEGTISSVPVPAAAWLFGTGLVFLTGVARRRTQATAEVGRRP